MTFVKEGRHSRSATTNHGAPPTLFQGFHLSKRHTALAIKEALFLLLSLVLLVLNHF